MVILFVLLSLLFVLATNKWMGWEQGIVYLSATDVRDAYERIARAAPRIPVDIAYHKVQRFLLPFGVGLFSHFSHVQYPYLFWVLIAISAALTLFFLYRVCCALKLENSQTAVCMAVFALSPYTLRYYLILPGMVNDFVFAAGASLLLLGLTERKFYKVILGLLLASLGRQTALMLLPSVTLWILYGSLWKTQIPSKKWSEIIFSIGLVLFIYLITGRVAAHFSGPSRNLEHLIGIFHWFTSPEFTFFALAEHTVRLLIPFFGIIGILATVSLKARLRAFPIEFWACILMTAAIGAQPFLAGPAITLGNGPRLAALGLAPAIVALAYALKRLKFKSSRVATGSLVLLALGSFHHMYSVVGPANAFQFLLLELAIALALFALLFCKTTIG